MMIYYYIFLVILTLIYLLFAYNLKMRIIITLNSLKVKVFNITIFRIKNEKFYNFLIKMIPKNEEEMKKNIDLTSLIDLFHFDLLKIDIKKSIDDYVNYIFLINITNIVNNIFVPFIRENIKEYYFKIKESKENNLLIDLKIRFNIGIILLNLLIIYRRYSHGKKTN